jgi:hypothetical protein
MNSIGFARPKAAEPAGAMRSMHLLDFTTAGGKIQRLNPETPWERSQNPKA